MIYLGFVIHHTTYLTFIIVLYQPHDFKFHFLMAIGYGMWYNSRSVSANTFFSGHKQITEMYLLQQEQIAKKYIFVDIFWHRSL